jgi:hypothetical protein
MSGDHNQYQKPTSKDSLQVEAMKQALEALEEIHHGNMTPMAETNWNKAITSLHQAIEQAGKQESVASMIGEIFNAAGIGIGFEPSGVTHIYSTGAPELEPAGILFDEHGNSKTILEPRKPVRLDVSPQPQREWVSLTKDEIYDIAENDEIDWPVGGTVTFARLIEAELKEKNHERRS